MLINLLLGETILRTSGSHQLTGYVGKYLGTKGKALMTLTMVAGIYGALIAYVIGTGAAIHAMLPGISPIAGSIAQFAIASAIVYLGLKAVEKSEFLLSALTMITIGTIIIVSFTSEKFSISNFTQPSIPNLFLPYGVVLFAFLGAVAIPEMKEEIGRNRKLLRKALIAGGLIPIDLYSLFAVAVVGMAGDGTKQIATITLGEKIGSFMVIYANLFAVLAMSTSFIALGLALKEMYCYDYNLGNKKAWALTCLPPLLAFLIGIKSFIGVIGIAGALSGGIEGILIVLMHEKSQKKTRLKPEYKIRSRLLAKVLISIFALALAYVIIKLIKG